MLSLYFQKWLETVVTALIGEAAYLQTSGSGLLTLSQRKAEQEENLS